ncbi:MAG: hypothetical protein K6C94_05335 [Candidatus Gastranaerophilales bacterium]|nr:hypothetical protein [Candidatus Gastranaerophilales bacterium]
MKKLFFVLFISCFLFTAMPASAVLDWDELYENSKPFPSKLMNNIDPFQDEDNLKYAYTPYPLFRTSAHLYYKGMKIDPGYYQLTPRKMNGSYYILFKTNGKVKFIIPVVKKEIVPAAFYKKYMPNPKLTVGQATAKNWTNMWGKVFKGSGKQPPPKAFVEMENQSTCYVLKFYYKEMCYYTVYKKVPY